MFVFEDMFCLYTVLSAVVSADGGHLVGGPGHAESVCCADALSVGLADAEPHEIQTTEIIQMIGVKIEDGEKL